MVNKEAKLYDAFIDALINKIKSGSADIKELALVKDFLNEKNIGANPKTHPQTKELAELPFDDEDGVETNVTPLRVSKKK